MGAKNNTTTKSNKMITSNLSVIWSEKMGMCGKFEVYQDMEPEDIAEQMLDAKQASGEYAEVHKTKKGYTFVMKEGYSVKIAKFAHFAKAHPEAANEYRRNVAKGLRQDPDLLKTTKAIWNKSVVHMVTDQSLMIWVEYEDAQNSTYEFFDDPNDARKHFAQYCKEAGTGPNAEDGFQYIDLNQRRYCLGAFHIWKQRFPNDFAAFVDSKKVIKKDTKDLYHMLRDEIIIWAIGEVNGVEDLLACWTAAESTVTDAFCNLGISLGLEPFKGVIPDNTVPTIQSDQKGVPSFYVAPFDVFEANTPEAVCLAEAYLAGKSFYVKNQSEYIPDFI